MQAIHLMSGYEVIPNTEEPSKEVTRQLQLAKVGHTDVLYGIVNKEGKMIRK